MVVTNGVISGLHLSLIAATRPGALVGVENPTYPNIPRVVNTERRRITPLDVASGFPAALTAVLHSGTLDAAIITPDFHNPTGHVLSEAHRTNILRAAAVSRTPLIIDESLVTFNWRGKETAHRHSWWAGRRNPCGRGCALGGSGRRDAPPMPWQTFGWVLT